MAQAPRSPDGNDNFIRHIVTDPKNVPDVMLLTGYLGASSEEAHERLYLSADLTNYVEIPNTAILHQAPLPKEQDAHGGVTLWVRKDAALQYKMSPAAQALANYFAGAIQAGAQGAPGAPAPQPDHAPPSGCIAQPSIVHFIVRQKSRLASTRTRIPVSAPSRMPARRRTSSASRRAPAPMWAVELRLHAPKGCFAAELPPPSSRPDQAQHLGRAALPSLQLFASALQTSRLASTPTG